MVNLLEELQVLVKGILRAKVMQKCQLDHFKCSFLKLRETFSLESWSPTAVPATDAERSALRG